MTFHMNADPIKLSFSCKLLEFVLFSMLVHFKCIALLKFLLGGTGLYIYIYIHTHLQSLKKNLPRFYLNGSSGWFWLKKGWTKTTFYWLKDHQKK